MDGMMIVTLITLGLVGGCASGLLGIGGGILMTPLLLYVPPALGLNPLGMKAVAALTMAQGLSGSVSGTAVHRKFRHFDAALVLRMGMSMGTASLLGAVLSSRASDQSLQGIFAAMALAAAALMLKPLQGSDNDEFRAEVTLNTWLAVIFGLGVGFLGGMVGQGGAFIVLPVMLHVLRVPTRMAIGSSLGVVFFSSAAGFVGKVATNQMPWLAATAMVAGAVPGARIGALLSRRVRTPYLRLALSILIAITAIRMSWEVIR
ncbi:MAG: sulfite exporter TauE/SafE family protein [Armatimonadota bacterium]|nr:sulfite exporter TauE/SafE family protein [Armatimonadota bacterium]